MPVYGYCDANCKYPVYTTEEVLSLLQQVIENGSLSGIDPSLSPIVALVKNSRNNSDLSFWSGTEAEFNALSPAPDYVLGMARIGADGKVYFTTNDSTLQAWHDKTVEDSVAAAVSGVHSRLEVRLTAAGWTGGKQTVFFPGMTEAKTVFVSPRPDCQSLYKTSEILCMEQGEGTLTFACSTVPGDDVFVNVVCLEVLA